VLSALDGIKTPVPGFAPYVLPLSIFVLIALFCLLRRAPRQPRRGVVFFELNLALS
jgi:K+ transporter